MTRMQAMTAAAIALVLAAPALAQSVSSAAVDADTVKLIETSAVLPKGVSQIGDYLRYYDAATVQLIATDGIGERDVIQGVWLKRATLGRIPQPGATPIPGVPGAFSVAKDGGLPMIADGGCDVLTVYLDVKTRKIIQRKPSLPSAAPDAANVHCNGLA